MKVLYIGHYRERSGWANVTIEQMRALENVGVEVVARNVTLTQDRDIPIDIQRMEDRSSDGCEVCIQHVLPHHLSYSSDFRLNVAFVELETESNQSLHWETYLDMMDMVMTPYRIEGMNSVVIPHPCDVSKYTKQYEPISMPGLEDMFKFYFIGELNDRKNIEGIVRCFHSTFDPAEPAVLILKVKKFGKQPHEVKAELDQIIAKVKNDLRLFPSLSDYKKDVVITEDITDEQICGLHQYGDCFVNLSHGEAWCIPAFDACAFGNQVISSDQGGPHQYFGNNGWLIDGVYKRCTSKDSAFPDMFTGHEYWFDPCDMSTCGAMRTTYEEWEKDKAAGILFARQFDYNVIGQKMKRVLEIKNA